MDKPSMTIKPDRSVTSRYMIVECLEGHKFRLGLTDDGYRNCPHCDSLLGNPKPATERDARYYMSIGQAWREKRKVEHKSYRNNYYAVTGYVKELETLLLSNGIPLPTMKEDNNELPTRLEDSN